MSDAHETMEAMVSAIATAYRERAQLVALLAALYPSWWLYDVKEPGWRVVYLTLPTGMASWHIAEDDFDLFGHVPCGGPAWDGHTTAEKYARIRTLIERLNGDETV